MDKDLARKLRRLGYGATEEIAPVVLQFANGEQVSAGEVFSVRYGEKRVAFLVVPKCSPPCLLGRVDIKGTFPKLLSRALGGDAAEVVNVGGVTRGRSAGAAEPLFREENGHVVLGGGVYADGRVLPYTAPERKRSPTDRALIALCVGKMEGTGVLERCTPAEVALSQEIVLVDKYEAKQWPRVYPPRPEDEKRWRITLDCQPANALVYSVEDFRREGVKETTQHQSGALASLAEVPCEYKRVFAKVDLTDAYHSVRIPASLSRLFGLRVVDGTGQRTWFRYTRMPMGWKYAGIFFVRVLEAVLAGAKCEGYRLVVYMDDILICAASREACESALAEVVGLLTSKGFQVRPEKCAPPSETMQLCGYELTAGGG
jgi:hypothetical protein